MKVHLVTMQEKVPVLPQRSISPNCRASREKTRESAPCALRSRARPFD